MKIKKERGKKKNCVAHCIRSDEKDDRRFGENEVQLRYCTQISLQSAPLSECVGEEEDDLFGCNKIINKNSS